MFLLISIGAVFGQTNDSVDVFQLNEEIISPYLNGDLSELIKQIKNKPSEIGYSSSSLEMRNEKYKFFNYEKVSDSLQIECKLYLYYTLQLKCEKNILKTDTLFRAYMYIYNIESFIKIVHDSIVIAWHYEIRQNNFNKVRLDGKYGVVVILNDEELGREVIPLENEEWSDRDTTDKTPYLQRFRNLYSKKYASYYERYLLLASGIERAKKLKKQKMDRQGVVDVFASQDSTLGFLVKEKISEVFHYIKQKPIKTEYFIESPWKLRGIIYTFIQEVNEDKVDTIYMNIRSCYHQDLGDSLALNIDTISVIQIKTRQISKKVDEICTTTRRIYQGRDRIESFPETHCILYRKPEIIKEWFK